MDRREIVNAAAASFEEGMPLRAPSFDTERPPQPSDSFEPPAVLSIGGPITEVGINGRNDASRASEVLTGLYIPATNTAVIAGGTATHGTLLNWYLGQYETPDAVLGFKAAMDGNRDVYVEVPGGGGGLFSALSRAGLTDDIQRLKGGNITRPSYLYECLYAVRRFGVGEQATVRYGYRVVRADDGAFTTTDAYELGDCYRELRFIGELPPEYVDPTGGRDLSAPDADAPRSMQLEAPSGNVPTGHTATPTPRESVSSVPEEARMFTVSERTLGHARQLARLPFVFELSTDSIPSSDTDTIDFLIDFPTTNRRMPEDDSFRPMSRTSISLPDNGEQLGTVTFRFPPLSPDTPADAREAWRSFEGGGRLPTEDPTLFGFGNDLWPHVDWDFRDHPDITFATLIDRLREYAEAYRDIFGDGQASLSAPETGDDDVNVGRLLRRVRRFNFTVNTRRVGSPGGTQIIQFDISFRDRSLRDEDGRDSAILGSAITLSHGSVDTFVWRLPPVSAALITRGRLEDITTAAVAGTPLDGEVEVSIEPDSPRRNEWTPHIEDRTWPPYRDGDALLDTLQQTYRAYREQVLDAVDTGSAGRRVGR